MRWIKIIAQISQENHPVLLDTEAQLPDELFAQVQRAFPDSDPARLELRWAISVMNFIQALSRADEWSRDGTRLTPAELTAFYEDLVSFVVGGVTRLLGS